MGGEPVIHPHVEIVDVEPDGFAVVCELAGARHRSGRGELHVLHERGRVLRAVRTAGGPTSEFNGDLGPDLASRARTLREAAEVDRVVLVDRELLGAEAAALAAAASPEFDQPTAFRRSNAVFWASPAVVADPTPDLAYESWDALEERLRRLGADYQALVAGYAGDHCAFTLVARLVGGRVVHLTSLPGIDRPPRERAEELVRCAEQLLSGPVLVVLVADLDVLREVISSNDLPAALVACLPRALISRGLSI